VLPHRPSGGRVSVPGTLSQWISGLLLLAPFATGPSLIEVTGPFNERSYVDLTVSMMRCFGLTVEVGDDGTGGADPARGSGLAGLADRVSVVDGRLMLSSPAGGPTLLRVEIPCVPTDHST
ncbi:hypothetical protein ACFQ08_05425, partial [Streptosporangium algeriense]